MNEQYGAGVRPRVQYSWIGESWDWFKASPGTWIASLFILGAISLVPLMGFVFLSVMRTARQIAETPHFGSPTFSQTSPFTGEIFFLPLLVFEVFLQPFVYACALGLANRQIRGYSIGVNDVFAGARSYGRLFIINLFILLPNIAVIALGTAGLTISPWYGLLSNIYNLIVMSVMLPVPAMVADGVPVVEAISRGSAATKQDRFNAIGFVFVCWLIMLAGTLACGLGTMITGPMMYIVGAIAYRDLIGMPGMATSLPAHTPSNIGQWPPPPTPGAGPSTEQSFRPPSEKPPLPPDFNE